MRGLVVFGTCFIAAIAAAALVVPCNFLILSAALAGRAGCGARPSSLPDSCGKTQVRLSGHSKVFSALELRGKSITVKESKRYKAAASFCSG